LNKANSLKIIPSIILVFFLLGAGQKTPPRRIVSLVPFVTEELFQLGVGDKIAGVTVFCNYPEEAKKKEKIGAFLQPNIEKIVTLSPDIVFATKEGHKNTMVEKLKNTGINVFVFEPCSSFNDVSGQFLQLSGLVGEKQKAEKILLKVNKRINAVKRENILKRKPGVFWQVGANPLITSGKNTFADEMITFAGGINIAGESKIRYPRYNREEVIRKNPDIIIITDMGIETASETAAWQKYPEINAVKNKKIFILDGHGVLSPTPLSYAEALEKIAKLFHEQ